MSAPANRHPGVGRAGTSAEYAARIPAIRADVRRLRLALAETPTLVLRIQLLDALRRLHWYASRVEVTRPRKADARYVRPCRPASLNRPGRPRTRPTPASDAPRDA